MCPTRELFWEGFDLATKSKAGWEVGTLSPTPTWPHGCCKVRGLPLGDQAEKVLEILATGMAMNYTVNFGELPCGFFLPFGKGP